MPFRRTLISAVVLALGIFILASPAFARPSAAVQKTLDNLMTAYNGESNAHAKYLAFADKADQEGFGAAASLFRAAARAEQVHAQNHAEVIKELGGTAKADVKTPEVMSTKENIQAAIQGETYERDTMYPQFISEARSANVPSAIRTFNLAKTAEAEHARLYTSTGNSLAPGAAKVTYYVCTICGYTTTKVDFEKCPSCFSPKEKYVTVA